MESKVLKEIIDNILTYKEELKEMWDTEVYKKLPPID